MTADASTIFASPYPSTTTGQEPPVAPDDRVPSATTDQLVAIDTRTGQSSVLLVLPVIEEVAPAPEGAQVAVTIPPVGVEAGTGFSTLSLLDPNIPQVLRDLPALNSESSQTHYNPAWSPDGRSLAYHTILPDSTNEVHVVDLATNETRVVYQTDGRTADVISLDWSPDGRHLLAAGNRIDDDSGEVIGRAIEIDLEGRTSSVVLEGVYGHPVYSAADGSRISMVNDGYGSADGPGSATAWSWTRAEDGSFRLTDVARVGEEYGLVRSSQLDIPECALA